MRRIATAVVVAGVVVLAAAGCGGAGAGPFAWPSDAGSSGFRSPVRPGQMSVISIVMPRTLSTPAVLLDLHPLYPQDARGLTLRYGGTTGLGLELGGQHGWPARKYQLHPLVGFVIPAHVRGGVAIGASATQRGIHQLRAFVVDYQVGGTRYSATMQVGFELCVGYRMCP